MVHQNELTQSDNISSFAGEHVHKLRAKKIWLRTKNPAFPLAPSGAWGVGGPPRCKIFLKIFKFSTLH